MLDACPEHSKGWILDIRGLTLLLQQLLQLFN
jgi:hypothetical protein